MSSLAAGRYSRLSSVRYVPEMHYDRGAGALFLQLRVSSTPRLHRVHRVRTVCAGLPASLSRRRTHFGIVSMSQQPLVADLSADPSERNPDRASVPVLSARLMHSCQERHPLGRFTSSRRVNCNFAGPDVLVRKRGYLSGRLVALRLSLCLSAISLSPPLQHGCSIGGGNGWPTCKNTTERNLPSSHPHLTPL